MTKVLGQNLDALAEGTIALAELRNSWDGTFFFEVSPPQQPDSLCVDMLSFERKNVFEELAHNLLPMAQNSKFWAQHIETQLNLVDGTYTPYNLRRT